MAHQTRGVDPTARFARRLKSIEREVRQLALTPQLSNSSVEGGTLDFNDDLGQPSISIGTLPDGTNAPLVVGGPVPPAIQGVDATPFAAGILASWDGSWDSELGVAPLDFSRTEVHVSVDGPDFEPDLVGAGSTTLQGTIGSARGGRYAITGLTYVDHWVKFVPRTLTGKWGPATAPVGPVMPGKLSSNDLEETVLAAGFVLAGAIQIGGAGVANPITLSGTEGFVAPQPDGGEIRFPVDGTPARITAHIVAFSMHVKDELTLSGRGTVNGELVLADAILAPRQPPTISAEWPWAQTALAEPGQDVGHDDFYQGLTKYHGPSDWLVVAYAVKLGPTWYSGLRPFHRETHQFVTYPDPTQDKPWTINFQVIGGVVQVDGGYVVLGKDHSRGHTYFYKISGTTWQKEAEWRVGTGLNVFFSRPRLVADGLNAGVVWKTSGGALYLRWFTPSGQQSGADILLLATYPGGEQLGGAYFGDAGTGSQRLYVASRLGDSGSLRFVRAFDPSASYARAAANDFGHAQNSQIIGMHYDDIQGRMVTLDNTSKIWTYSKFVEGYALAAQYTWYDGDNSPYPPGTYIGEVDVSGLPSGTKETPPSPTRQHSLPARTWPVIEMPPPPDESVVSPEKVDRANRIGVYLAGPSTSMAMRRHAYLANTSGRAERVVRGVDVLPAPGAPAPPTNNGFAGAVSNPGTISSAAARLDGRPSNEISGSGPARLDGLIRPGTMMFWHKSTPPNSEWLFCSGGAVSRTGHADLFASIGTTFGAGDGSTTFNLPTNLAPLTLYLIIKS